MITAKEARVLTIHNNNILEDIEEQIKLSIRCGKNEITYSCVNQDIDALELAFDKLREYGYTVKTDYFKASISW